MDIGDGISAIATLMAALAAFAISRQWENQKGKEFVADEAKLLIKSVNGLLANEDNVYKLLKDVSFSQGDDEDIQRSLDYLYRDAKKLLKDLEFFEDVLHKNNILKKDSFCDEILPIIRLCSSYICTYKNRTRLIANSLYKNTDNGSEESISYDHCLEITSNELSYRLNILKNHLLPFASYKFQHKKRWLIF